MVNEEINKIEVLNKLKELKELSNGLSNSLEKHGILITDINKERLFESNIKSTITAIEGLLRNEPSEKHTLRLQKEIPDSYKNISEVKKTNAGKLNSIALDKLKSLMSYFEQIYERI